MRYPGDRPSPAASHRRHQANRWLALTLAATLLAGILLRAFPPEAWAFYPACPFHQWTGLLCPGCGGTRAVAGLARGEFREAMRSNSLVLLALVVCAGWLAAAYARAIRGRQPVWPHVPVPAIIVAAAVALIFGIARNLV